MSQIAESNTHAARAHKLLESRHLILASNRGPFEFRLTEQGVERKRGAGGVVTAVSAISRYANPTWVAAAMTAGDRQVAEQQGGEALSVEDRDYSYLIRFVTIPEDVYNGYYNVIANPLLWFIQHYMWDTPREPQIGPNEWDAWRNGYVEANRLFAQVISEEIRRSPKPPVVMIQDYQLYLVAGMLRREHPDVPIQFFLHIPFPGSDYLRILPVEMRQEIVRSMLACDIVGFQTNRSAINFLRAAGSFLPGVRIDYDNGLLSHNGRTTVVRRYPISIDIEGVRSLARCEQAERELEFLRPYFAEKNILRVDRIEPSKNILRGFEAYSLMLTRHPEFKQKVKFLAFLVPSRSTIAEYEQYQDEVMAALGRINLLHGTDYWRPVEAFIGDNYVRALAAMREYDVLLVNPVIDGMNLVAKEGVIVNERNGALVLSDGAGAFEQFAPLPFSVSAADVYGTAEALYTALTSSEEERQALSDRLRRCVEGDDVTSWLNSQLEDLAVLCEEGPVPATVSDQWRHLLALLRDGPAAFLTDIDGTISRITETPYEAKVEPEAARALDALLTKISVVAAVTGRSPEHAYGMVGVRGMLYIGNHGLEEYSGGVGKVAPEAQAYLEKVAAALKEVQHWLEIPGIVVENKGITASVHYRMTAAPETTRNELMQLLRPIAERQGLLLREGRMVIELRPKVDVTKGTAVRALIERLSLRSCVFMGDDVTDTDVFRTLREMRKEGLVNSVCIGVLSSETPREVLELSDFTVDGVDGAVHLLTWLVQNL